MHRTFRAVATHALGVGALLVLLLAGGCASSPEPNEPPPGAAGATDPAAGDAGGPPDAAAKPAEKDGPKRPRKATGLERAGQYALAVPANILWIPWKIIGGGVKGASDGVYAGFDKGRLPLFGTIFSPVNLVVGLGTGAVEGLVMSPGLVGPDDDFGRAMSLPTKRSTSIWWYP